MTSSGGSRRLAYFQLAAGMAVFGSATPVSKIVGEAFPVFAASWARMLIAALALAPLLMVRAGGAGLREEVAAIARADWVRLVAIAAFGMVGFSVLMLYGMREIPGAVGGVVMATTPAVTATGAVLFLRERLGRWHALAIALAVGGVLAVNLGSASGAPPGSDLVLGTALVFGAVCGEAAYTLLGKRLTADLTPLSITGIVTVLALALFTPIAAVEIGSLDWDRPGPWDWLALAWWGLGTLALGSLLWYRGVSSVAGTTASAFMGVMPVSALLLSYLLLGESFDWPHAVGAAAVLGGIAAVIRGDRGGSG